MHQWRATVAKEKFCPENKRILRMNKFKLKSRGKILAMRIVRLWRSLLVTDWLRLSYNSKSRSITFWRKQPHFFLGAQEINCIRCVKFAQKKKAWLATIQVAFDSCLNSSDPFIRGSSMAFYSCLQNYLNEWHRWCDHSVAPLLGGAGGNPDWFQDRAYN